MLLALLLGTLVVASFALGSTHPATAEALASPAGRSSGARVVAAARGGFETLREPAAIVSQDADLALPSTALAPTPAPTPPPEAPASPPTPPTEAPSSAAAVALPTPAADPAPEAAVATPAPRTPAPRPAVVAPVVAPVVVIGSSGAELRMLSLMNASRARSGLGALALDAGVSVTARAHSAAESRVGYVYHDGPDGTAQRRDTAACGTGWYGENTGKVWNGNVDALHWEFMAEPLIPINHRTNIVDPTFRRVGIGAVQGSDALYLTMVFCR